MMKTIVIKLGGSALENSLPQLAETVRGLRERGSRVVIVHGGGPAINKELTSRGISWTFVNGQRRTTLEMIDVIEDVLAGSVNETVVSALKGHGITAVGVSGVGVLACRQKSEDLGLVGDVIGVNLDAIEDLLSQNEVPVIAPIGGTGAGDDLAKFNVNADVAATKIAMALKADELIFLTDQDGVLNGDKALVTDATPRDFFAMIDSGVVSGGMCTKVLAMIEAVKSGVSKVRVLNALESQAILSPAKTGTTLWPQTSEKTTAKSA